MNVKKFLKKKSKEDLQSLETEEDREFLKRLQDSVSEKQPKKRSRHWLWAIPSAVAACVVAVVLIVEYVPFHSTPNDVKYEEKDFVQVDSDLTLLSQSLNGLTVQIAQEQMVKVYKTYDSVSGDNLYFTLAVDETSDSTYFKSEFRIIVNENYKYDDFNETVFYKTETYPDYTVKYSQEVVPDSATGLNLVRCTAKIESAHYEIYVIKYEEYSLADGTFLTVINNLFTFQ